MAAVGDPVAWGEIIARYNAAIIGVFVSHRIPLERGRELAQDLWITLYTKHEAGKLPYLRLPGLAFHHARLRALDELRRLKTRNEVALDPTSSDEAAAPRHLPSPLPSPTDAVVGRRQLALTRRVLLSMPARQAQVLALVRVQGLSHRDAAEQMGVKPQRSKSLLTLANKRLRAIVAMTDPMREAYLMVHADGRQHGAICLELGLTRTELEALLQEAFHHIKKAGGVG